MKTTVQEIIKAERNEQELTLLFMKEDCDIRTGNLDTMTLTLMETVEFEEMIEVLETTTNLLYALQLLSPVEMNRRFKLFEKEETMLNKFFAKRLMKHDFEELSKHYLRGRKVDYDEERQLFLNINRFY